VVVLLVFFRSFLVLPLLMPADQIEQREEIDPDNVDKVPVEAEVLDKRDVPRGVAPAWARRS
jgi:hypothetical protein